MEAFRSTLLARNGEDSRERAMQIPGAKRGKEWEGFSKELELSKGDLPHKGRFDRRAIRALARRRDIDIDKICAAIMAWGGMRPGSAETFFKAKEPGWLEIAERVQNGEVSRRDAYEDFRILREAGKLPGCGPAYFTKLIHFLTPVEAATQGYIMDQWAGCSVNLLVGAEIVHMNTQMTWKKGADGPDWTFTVSDFNTGDRYERFCAAIDTLVGDLKGEFDLNADQIDDALVSKGGRNPACWRAYVKKHRKP